MSDRRKNKFYLDDPIVVLNGLVTDKNNYPYNEKIEFLSRHGKIVAAYFDNDLENNNFDKISKKEKNMKNT